MVSSAHHVHRTRLEAAMAALATKKTDAMTTLRLAISFFSNQRPSKRSLISAARKRRRLRVPQADHTKTTALQFEPLDSSIVSDSIPAFFIGRNSAGFWVAREATGRIGGLFVLKRSALSFVYAQSRPVGCATIFPSERFELDLENQGNTFASHLAPLLRHTISLWSRIEKLLRAHPFRSKDFRAS